MRPKHILLGPLPFWNLLDLLDLCLVIFLALVVIVIVLAFGLLYNSVIRKTLNILVGPLAF